MIACCVRSGMVRTLYGFPRGQHPFGVECVISREPPIYAREDGSVCARAPADKDLRLDCNRGLGTASFVTGTFAFVAASRIVGQIADGPGVTAHRVWRMTRDGARVGVHALACFGGEQPRLTPNAGFRPRAQRAARPPKSRRKFSSTRGARRSSGSASIPATNS